MYIKKLLYFIMLLFLSNAFSQEKSYIGVLDLDAEGISKSEAKLISVRLRNELFNTGEYSVLEREKMEEILKEQGFQLTGCTSNECAVKIGKLIDVQKIVAGNIGKIGNLITINIRLIDVESGIVLNYANDDCDCNIETVLTQSVRKVAQILSGKKIKSASYEEKKKKQKMEPSRFNNPKKFAYEFLGGIRAPLGVARDDISTGFTFQLGIGYQLTKNLEIFHAAVDFGTSTPHDPLWVTVYDPYNYYPRLEQETVYVYGIPVTMRYRFQIHDQLEVYFGGGAAYYWFQTKLTDPYWGELKKSRKRHGPGGLFQAGIFTDAFGEKILAGLTINALYLNTEGKTLTTPKLEDDPDKRVSRSDIYFTIGISLRYYIGE